MAVAKTKPKGKVVKKGANPIPPSASFTVVLSELYSGTKPVIRNAKCGFSYIWDFTRNMGLAHLTSIDGCEMDIVLHPLGIAGMLGFMSDMPPTPVVINGQRVVLYRILLNIYKNDGERAAAIMFNTDGSVIETTKNWRTQTASGLSAQ